MQSIISANHIVIRYSFTYKHGKTGNQRLITTVFWINLLKAVALQRP